MKKQPIDCVIVDDEILACDRLETLLQSFEKLVITGIFSAYLEAIESILENRPRLLFLDVELDKNFTAFDIIDQIQSTNYSPFIILITAYDHYSIRGIKREIFDYLVKPIDLQELKDTIARLERHIDLPKPHEIVNYEILSERERQVLSLLFEGKTSLEIAKRLFVSKSTIDTHRRNILKKTEARSTIELIGRGRNI